MYKFVKKKTVKKQPSNIPTNKADEDWRKVALEEIKEEVAAQGLDGCLLIPWESIDDLPKRKNASITQSIENWKKGLPFCRTLLDKNPELTADDLEWIVWNEDLEGDFLGLNDDLEDRLKITINVKTLFCVAKNEGFYFGDLLQVEEAWRNPDIDIVQEEARIHLTGHLWRKYRGIYSENEVYYDSEKYGNFNEYRWENPEFFSDCGIDLEDSWRLDYSSYIDDPRLERARRKLCSKRGALIHIDAVISKYADDREDRFSIEKWDNAFALFKKYHSKYRDFLSLDALEDIVFKYTPSSSDPERYSRRMESIAGLSWQHKDFSLVLQGQLEKIVLDQTLSDAEWQTCLDKTSILLDNYKNILSAERIINLVWSGRFSPSERERFVGKISSYSDRIGTIPAFEESELTVYMEKYSSQEWSDRLDKMCLIQSRYRTALSSYQIKTLSLSCDIYAHDWEDKVSIVALLTRCYREILDDKEILKIVMPFGRGSINIPEKAIRSKFLRSFLDPRPLGSAFRCPVHGQLMWAGRRLVSSDSSKEEKTKVFFCNKCKRYYAPQELRTAKNTADLGDWIKTIKGVMHAEVCDGGISTSEKIKTLLNATGAKVLYTSTPTVEKCQGCMRGAKYLKSDNVIQINFIDGTSETLPSVYCKHCNAVTVSNQEIALFADICNADYIESVEIKSHTITEAEIVHAKESFAPKTTVLHIYKGRCSCQEKKHRIGSVTLHVPYDGTDGEAVINANYCYDCDMFYISKDEYFYLKSRYPVKRLKFKTVSDTGKVIKGNKATESVLRMYGYTVNAKDELSDEERQSTLRDIISDGIATKTEVIDFLNERIKFNGSAKGLEKARSKWIADLAYVREYQLEVQPEAYVDDIVSS